MNVQEEGWLQGVLKGDEESFARLVEAYQTPVYNLCYRMLGNMEEAEDAAQETFWRAYKAIRRYDPNRSFITWLLSIAAHYCIDQQRRFTPPSLSIEWMPDEDIPDAAPNPEQEAYRSEEQRMLHSLLNQLNPQDRAVIILRYWHEMSHEEIAQTLSLTESAVKSRLHRARLQLAKSWPSLHPDAHNSEKEKYESRAF